MVRLRTVFPARSTSRISLISRRLRSDRQRRKIRDDHQQVAVGQQLDALEQIRTLCPGRCRSRSRCRLRSVAKACVAPCGSRVFHISIPGCGAFRAGSYLGRCSGRRSSSGAGLIGIVEGGAVVQRDLSAHVIERLAQHAGDVKLHLPAVGRWRGNLPGVQPIAGGFSELNRHFSGCGKIDGIAVRPADCR